MSFTAQSRERAARTKAMRKSLNCTVTATPDLKNPKFRGAEVGVMIGKRTQLKPSTVQCPYCEELMQEAESMNPSRIVRVMKRTAGMAVVMAHPIPLTHRTLGCYTCRVSFTVPRDREAAMERPSR